MRKCLAFGWLLIVALAGAHLCACLYGGIKLRADLLALVPREEQAADVASVSDNMMRSLSGKVVFLVGHVDQNVVNTSAKKMAQAMARSGLVDVVTGSGLDADRFKQLGAAYFPYRLGLLSAVDRSALLEQNPQKIIGQSLSQAFGVASFTNAGLLKSDPFLLMPRFMSSLPVPMSKLSLTDGLLSVRENGVTWVLVSGALKGEPYAMDFQKIFVEEMDKTIGTLKAESKDIQVLRTGAVFFAKEGADQAMTETSIIGIVSIVGTIALLLLVFRSTYPLMMSLMVIAVGMVVALSFSLWYWRDLHVFSLLFGVSLIGVTVDYSLQYFAQVFTSGSDAPQKRLQNVMMGIALGAGTTMIGYATLLLAPFPGLRQIALFSVVGLFAACVTVFLWFPYLDKMSEQKRAVPFLSSISFFLSLWTERKFKWLRIVFAFLCVVLAVCGAVAFHNDDDVHKLQSPSSSLVQQQERIQQIIGSSVGNQFLVVKADNDEMALQQEELLQDDLEDLKVAGALSGFQSLAQYIPSLKRQAENRKMVIDELYKPFLAGQADTLGLTVLPKVPAEEGEGLAFDKVFVAMKGLGFFSMLRPISDYGVLHVITLDGVKDTGKIAAVADKVSGVRLIDPANDFSRLFAKYRLRSLGLLFVSALLMLLPLWKRYGLRRGAAVMVAPAVSVVLAPLLCALGGCAFTFFDAIALVLVFSMGVDYAVFFVETTENRKAMTMFAVIISACTTLMSFGFLSLSHVLAVSHFGLTMLVGISLCLVLVPLSRCIVSGKALGKILPLLCVFVLMGCATQQELPQEDPSRVAMAPGLVLQMPSFHDLGRDVDVVQNVVAKYGDQIISFEGRIKATPDAFRMTCADPMGRKAVSIEWTDKGLMFEAASWVPSQLKPQNILADLIFIYWPKPVVEKAFGHDVRLVETREGRSVYLQDKEILRAVYVPLVSNDIWAGSVKYQNQPWHYSLSIQSVALDP